MPVDVVDSAGMHEEKGRSEWLGAKLLAGAEDLLIGRSAAMREVHTIIGKVAQRKSPVLIQGETGTGKELVAQAIHLESRRLGQLIPVNVAAIPDSLFESELFGHVRGAFSGALANQTGFVRRAMHGTLFLDEIGELSLPLQAKLLRLLDTHEVTPVGADQDIAVDMQIVVATNADLQVMVNAGTFRLDLWHRLQGVEIYVPPLRDRVDDIPLLVKHFAEKIAKEYAVTQIVFAPSALELLQRHRWPGNVRELREVVGRLALEETPLITAVEVRRVLREDGRSMTERCESSSDKAVREERAELEALLRLHGGNVARVAAELQMVPSTVYRRMRRLGIRVAPRGRKPRPNGEKSTGES